jgi:hypothetical protein
VGEEAGPADVTVTDGAAAADAAGADAASADAASSDSMFSVNGDLAIARKMKDKAQ